MAYTQNNNPLKKENKSFRERHQEWRDRRKEKSQEKGDDGLTNFQRMWAEKKAHRESGGKSKYQRDIEARREGYKTKPETTGAGANTKPKSKSTLDPNREVNIGDNEPSWEWKTQERNPGDLREQSRYHGTTLPSAPGDMFEYDFDEEGNIAYIDTSKGEDAKWQFPELGSDDDRAIRKRYTGSETGDLSSWYGHDTSGWTSSYDVDPTTGDIDEGTSSHTDFEKKSYLPYDLAQKKYNPKYKGSKK